MKMQKNSKNNFIPNKISEIEKENDNINDINNNMILIIFSIYNFIISFFLI